MTTKIVEFNYLFKLFNFSLTFFRLVDLKFNYCMQQKLNSDKAFSWKPKSARLELATKEQTIKTKPTGPNDDGRI